MDSETFLLGWRVSICCLVIGFSTQNQQIGQIGLGSKPAMAIAGVGRLRVRELPSRVGLQLEVLETRCLLSAGDLLAVTTPPPGVGWPGGPGLSGLVAGTSFGLTVTAEKADGTVDTSYNGSVTIASALVGSNTPSALNGPLTVTAVNGVATFSGLTEDDVAWFSLQISGSDLPATANAGTSLFTTAGPASQLVISRPQPSSFLDTQHSEPITSPFYNPITKAPFGLEVVAEDRFGNMTNFDGDVTISLGDNPAAATLGGTLTVHMAGTFVDLDNLILDTVGSGVTLQATAAGLTAGISPAFAVTEQLVVTTQPPSSVEAGTPFGLVVKVEDGLGNVDTNFNGDISVTSADFTSLQSTVTVTAVNGVATFTGVTEAINGNDNLDISAGPLVRDFLSDAPASVSTDAIRVLDGIEPPGSGVSDPPGNIELPFLQTSTANQTSFVAALYRDVLGRAPDAAGSSNWVAQLQAGASQQQVAQAFWESSEHRTLEVTGYYQSLLQRTPDAAGLANWVSALQAGQSETAVELAFMTSPEFLAKHSSTGGDFLNALYEGALGRAATAAEIASWQNQVFPLPFIPFGAPPDEAEVMVDHEIALGVLNSSEASMHLIDMDYSQFLQRSVDPTGAQYWLAALQGGASPTALSEGILGSNEYFWHAASS